jgi:hypothetical protein
MKFDKMFRLNKITDPVPDGMGGWIDTDNEENLGAINTFITPVTAEIMMKDFGVLSTTAIKIFTQQRVPNIKGMYLTYVDFYNGIEEKYEILQIADYGKYFMILAQKEGD